MSDLDDNTSRLICFDFDQTIVNDHYHNRLSSPPLTFKTIPYTNGNGLIINGEVQNENKNNEYDKEKVKEEVEKLLMKPATGIKNPESLLNAFKDLLSKGHKIAITSFSKYPDAITITLEKLGLNSEETSKIAIIVGHPTAGPENPHGKKEHTDAAMKHFNITDYSKVALIDDDIKNIERAGKLGVLGIYVESDNKEYFKQIEKFVKGELKANPKNIDLNYFNNQAPSAQDHSTQLFKLGLPKKKLIDNKNVTESFTEKHKIKTQSSTATPSFFNK